MAIQKNITLFGQSKNEVQNLQKWKNAFGQARSSKAEKVQNVSIYKT